MSKKSFIQRIPGFRSGVRWKTIVASIFYALLFLAIVGALTPPTIEGQIQQAQEYAGQGNYKSAVRTYEKILKRIEEEGRGTEYKAQVEQELAQARADIILDEAEQHFEKGNVEKALECIAQAAELVPNYERIASVNEAWEDAIMDQVYTYVGAAIIALETWDLAGAREAIDSISRLMPDYEDLAYLEESLAEKKEIIAQIGPKPQNSLWDGSVACVKDYLNKVLLDPYSVKYEEWSAVTLITYQGQDFWAVRVKYRAKNAFGAYILEEKVALMRNNQVVALLDY
jgi:tetratricopeptide (TPR) repeat protein